MLKNLLKLALLITVFTLFFQACKDKNEAEKTFTVTYDLNGGTGTVPAPQVFKIGGSGIPLNNGGGLTKTGFIFGGWAEKGKTNLVVLSPYTPSSNVTLYAIWNPVYIVDYNLSGGIGVIPVSQVFKVGGEGIALNDGGGLTKTGFAFSGWSEHSNTTVAVLSPYTPLSNVTLYAFWNAVYSVSYDINRGTGNTPESQTYTQGGAGITLNDGTGLSLTGFTFGGWAETAEEKTAISSPFKPSKNSRVYAIWNPSATTHVVTYDINSGTGNIPAPQIYTQEGGGITLNNGAGLTRFGFTFGGWAETAEGKTPIASPFKPSKNTTVYALWNTIFYTVSYNINGATGNTPVSQTYTQGGAGITLNSGAGLHQTGFAFGGWSETEQGKAPIGSPFKPSKNSTIYAIWNAVYSVSYNLNGGTGNTPAPQTYTQGGVGITLNNGAGLIRTEFTFGGWAATSSGNTALSNPYKPTANVTLYAIWQPINYTVSFHLNGADGMPPQQQNYTGGDGIALPTLSATRLGYTFAGWAATSSGNTALSNPYKPTANVTLYAIWQQNSYTVSFLLNGANGTPPQQQNYTIGGTGITLPSLSVIRLGYTFAGWAAINSGTTALGSPYTPTANVTLYAIWQQNQINYAVSFNLNGANGTAPQQQNYTGGTGITLPSTNVTRLGYTFAGWAATSSGTTALGSPYTPTASVTLYAIWQQNQINYAVSFNLNGANGTAPQQQNYTGGTGITLPSTNVTRLGYTFAGWAASSSGTTALGSPYTPTASVTLYAIWQPNSYTVSFDLNGANGTAPQQQNYTIGGAGIILPTFSATRLGYTFAGWAASSSGTTALGSPYTPTASVTLYAIWQPNSYTVSFDLNGANGTPPQQQNYIIGGAGITLPTISATRLGYTFVGWAVSSSGTTALGSPYTPTANVTLYAIWQPISYTVSFLLNGTNGTIPQQQTYTTGGAGITLPTISVTRLGYTFGGWAASSSGTTALGSPYTPTASITLYAIWQPNSYTVSFLLNGANGTPPQQQNYTIGGAGITLPTISATRLGYTFAGWAATNSGTTALGSPYTPTASVTLYAIWQPNSYTVSFDLNGANGTIPQQQNYTIGGSGITLPTISATRLGYTFAGWAATNSGTTALGSPYAPTANVTLYAIWQPISYTVSFLLNGANGTTPQQQTYTGGAGITLPTISVTRLGYTFMGWVTSTTGTTVLSSPYQPTASITLYAYWSQNAAFTLTSTTYTNGGVIPPRCSSSPGKSNTSPQLSWTGAPTANVVKYILVFFDATISMWHFKREINTDVSNLAEGTIPSGVSASDYFGPDPPDTDQHTYQFKLYAVKTGYTLDDFGNFLLNQSSWTELETTNAAFIVGASNVYSGTYTGEN